MKILISSYACSPNEGSEQGVGWGFVSCLCKYHDLYVLVDSKYKNQIEEYICLYPDSCVSKTVKFVFIKRLRSPTLEKIWPQSYYWTYREWHKRAFKHSEELHSYIGFDVAHQLTMVGFREPGYLWKLNIPFIWGPVGGMGLFPWSFIPKVGMHGALYYIGYNLINILQMRYARRPKIAAKRSSVLLAINNENKDLIKHYLSSESKVCIPVGPPPSVTETILIRQSNEPYRIVWVGLHLPRKALNLGLEALSILGNAVDWELHILGGGAYSEIWKNQAKKLEIYDRCRFYGNVSRDNVLKILKNSHVHLFTSLREGTPSVIVEAFSFALPTICLDISGMQDMVNDSCGIKVSVDSPTETVQALAIALKHLADDEILRQRLSKGALKRSLDFSWENKIDILNSAYSDAVASFTLTSKT